MQYFSCVQIINLYHVPTRPAEVFTGEEDSGAEMSFRELLHWNYQRQCFIYHGSGGLPKTSLFFFFFQIAELKEPCRDLRNAFLSTRLSISIVQLYE